MGLRTECGSKFARKQSLNKKKVMTPEDRSKMRAESLNGATTGKTITEVARKYVVSTSCASRLLTKIKSKSY